MDDNWSWTVGGDVGELHALLCACDAQQAADSGTPAPRRDIRTMERRIGDRNVHVLRLDGTAVGMVTLTWTPPFDLDAADYPPAERPAYMGRLAVHPEWLGRGSLVGARCIRKAVQVASCARADVVRSEANPDLTATRTLLELLGFRQHGDTKREARGPATVYLHKQIRPPC
jgi:GNAT superfamily N-acetyltransferase